MHQVLLKKGIRGSKGCSSCMCCTEMISCQQIQMHRYFKDHKEATVNKVQPCEFIELTRWNYFQSQRLHRGEEIGSFSSPRAAVFLFWICWVWDWSFPESCWHYLFSKYLRFQCCYHDHIFKMIICTYNWRVSLNYVLYFDIYMKIKEYLQMIWFQNERQ